MGAGNMSGFSAPDLYDVLKASQKAQDTLTEQYKEALETKREYTRKALEALRTKLGGGETTGDRIRDHVVTHYNGFNPQYEEWYHRVEERLKGYGGQFVLLHTVISEKQGPFRRYVGKRRHIMSHGPVSLDVSYYRFAVLTGEELDLSSAAAIPTGPQVLFSAQEEASTNPVFKEEIGKLVQRVFPFPTAKELFPLPRSLAGEINFSLWHLAPLIGGFAFEDHFVSDELFVGDDEVGEVFKKYEWPKKFWLSCVEKAGRLELVPPDEQTG